ncbi:MAG: trypsin-like peptidase domain-containing protein [Micromonosporaceae bacterium]|nr:trypsin-like peptidase domain-containing protein [Micromonosporaceae bacterium]
MSGPHRYPPQEPVPTGWTPGYQYPYPPGQQPYGQQPPFGPQPPYGQPPYGQQPYGQPPFWPPPYPGQLPPPPPKGTRPGAVVGALVSVAVLIAVALGAVVFLGRVMHQPSPAADGTRANPPAITIPPDSSTAPNPNASVNPTAIARSVNPAIVDVNTVLGFNSGRAAGTGIVLKSSGLVLTNNHVVSGATSVKVTEVTDGRAFDASVLGYDRTDDVALLQMKGASNLPTAKLADSSGVRIGDPIVAIGNAGGKGGSPSVVSGTITALNQSITASDEIGGTSQELSGLIQVAANIQAGDSGGPLVNASAKVIGINTAASVDFRTNQSGGDGFAIPINKAVAIINQIIAGQSSTKIHLGATGFLGIGVKNSQDGNGAEVSDIVQGLPADKGGLVVGDVIVSVNGEPVGTPNDLTDLLDRHHPGDKVSIGWTDTAGASHTGSFILATGPVG